MKLKNKTELRKEIKKSIGNTGEFDYIEIYEDGTWKRMGCSTYSNSRVHRIRVSDFSAEKYWGQNTDAAISQTFREIEAEVGGYEINI